MFQNVRRVRKLEALRLLCPMGDFIIDDANENVTSRYDIANDAFL
jgi:hypothetical protein